MFITINDSFSLDYLLDNLSTTLQYNDTFLDVSNASHENYVDTQDRSQTSSSLHPNSFASLAKKELKWALTLHTYAFGCLFFVLAFYTFFSILNLRSLISSRPFMSTINGFLCVLGISRSASLLIDPYAFKETIPKILGQILWDVGLPGIISAFCLVQLAFLQLTQLKLGPELVRRKTCLSLIITAHFTFTVAMDIIVAVQDQAMMMKYVVEYIFLCWGILLCCTFLYSGYKIMLLVRKIPGGFHRDVPDPNHKGIMQLAMLAPYNNLAGSVTAALLPTLCAPKIHQQDIGVATSSLGFRNDPNARILESESIPILEEVGCSSGDERSPLPPSRTSSFQNRTRASHRMNLKPKLSLQSGDEAPGPLPSPRSPRDNKDAFNFSPKPSGSRGSIPKATEAFVTTKDLNEFKNRKHSKTGFENENYKGVGSGTAAKEELLVPNIMVSCPSGRNSSEDIKQDMEISTAVVIEEAAAPHPPEVSQKEEALHEMISQIQQDLKEMNIERGGEERRSRRGGHPSLSRKSSGDGSRRSQRRDNQRLSVEQAVSRRSSGCSALSEISEAEDSELTGKDRKRQKSLSWRKKLREEEPNVQDCLLPQDPPAGDVSLTAILNHIAFVNRANMSAETASQDVDKTRRSEMEWVLNVTYITAMWGLMLCLTTMSQVQASGSFGGQDSRHISSGSVLAHQLHTSGMFSSPVSWLWFQTFCRCLELAMGCAMANITRQPTANSRYPHTLRLRHRSTF